MQDVLDERKTLNTFPSIVLDKIIDLRQQLLDHDKDYSPYTEEEHKIRILLSDELNQCETMVKNIIAR